MFTHFILVLSLLFPFLLGEFDPQEGRVQKTGAGVDFIHHSHADKLSDGKYAVTNFIKNNSDNRPLSVKWDEAGILCTGSMQLPPGQTDYGKGRGVMEKPFLKNNTDIRYGLTLQYEALARIYVDPQKRGSAEKSHTSTYERRDKNGKLVYLIETVSNVDPEIGFMTLTIRAEGGLSLIVPTSLGMIIEAGLPNKQWRLVKTRSLSKFGLKSDSSNFLAALWLNDIPIPRARELRPGNMNVESEDFYIIQNQGQNSIELMVLIRAKKPSLRDKFDLYKMNLIGFNIGTDGLIGMSANIYLPSHE